MTSPEGVVLKDVSVKVFKVNLEMTEYSWLNFLAILNMVYVVSKFCANLYLLGVPINFRTTQSEIMVDRSN